MAQVAADVPAAPELTADSRPVPASDPASGNRPVVARVRILDLPLSADRCYDYAVPSALAGKVRPGSLVMVSFGAAKSETSNRNRQAAIVAELADSSPFDSLKPILAVADERFALNEELLGLTAFLCDRTFCSTGEAVQTILPSAVSEIFRHMPRTPVERFYTLVSPDSGQDGKLRLGTAERRAVVYLQNGEVSETVLREQADVSPTTLKNLVSKGLLRVRTKELFRNPYADRVKEPDESPLSEEQEKAAGELSSLALSGNPCAAMLYGVTGSGKTRVVKAVIDRVLEAGRTAIVLVPEISLTGQTVDLFCRFFGERVAVIHSGLSAGERLDAFKRIRAHEVDVVIGTRSAVFAPLENIGVIVIDEEQEHTYKSDMNPKYHARDVARYRAAKNGALMLLASATPSVESFWKAKSGVYSLVTLKNRYGKAVLPEVLFADLREDAAKGKLSPIGTVLSGEIEANLSRGEQTVLFVGRRGYHNFVSCAMCGEVVTCPNCSVSLTYHREPSGDLLKCHYCGHTQTVPDKCPKCGSEHLGRRGFGTQLVAEELAAKFPAARVLRMDADSTAGKFAHEEILSKFRSHEADILIGTQMVTKGHNFPDVTLVGVISADSALYLNDFRATERTFALLTQVIGRAGRAEKPGRAVIQTYNPDNDTLRLSAAQDYEGFYANAIPLRQSLVFPPFCEFLLLAVTGGEEKDVLETSAKLNARLDELLKSDYADVSLYKFGPFEAPVYRVNNIYRMRIILKCAVTKRVRELTRRLLYEFSKNAGATVSADVNPNGL